MQHFVDGFVAQCKRHRLRAELIMVEWNPPADRAPLAEELRWPADTGPCDIRIVTVPRELHARFRNAGKIPLYQMIAKNVGIRRARGLFVLATNVDILFSDASIQCMRDRLEPQKLYRAYRVDIPPSVPDTSEFDDVLRFCREQGFRTHGVALTVVKKAGAWRRADLVKLTLDPRLTYLLHLIRKALGLRREGELHHARDDASGALHIRRLLRPWAFTNACGDFTLLSRDDWFRLRGYAEWDLFSWHLDSLFVLQAIGSGCRQVVIGRDAPVFHIEHGKGYTPEGAAELFSRLTALAVPFVSDADFLRLQDEIAGKQGRESEILYNDSSWGMAGEQLPETRPRTAST